MNTEPDQTNYAGGTEKEWAMFSEVEPIKLPVPTNRTVRKIGIVGHGNHGKDEFANRLAHFSGLSYHAGTSVYAADIVFPQLHAKYPWARKYVNSVACWLDRRNHRDEWAKAIDEYNRNDPAQLYKDCLGFQDILTGLRWRHEFKAVKDAGIVDLWIFVFDPRKPLEPSFQIMPEDCDGTVVNDGTKEQLHTAARLLADEIKSGRVGQGLHWRKDGSNEAV